MRLSVLAVLLTMAIPAWAAPYPRVASYDLDVSFEPGEARLEGQAEIRFDGDAYPLATVKFFLHGELRVESLHSGGEQLEFAQGPTFYEYEYSLVATEVTADLSQLPWDAALTVVYSGAMNPSLAGSPSNYMRIDESGVFLRSYGYSLWFPTFLPPRHDEYRVDFPTVRISTPSSFSAIFTGTRQREFLDGKRRISVWQAEDVSLFDAQCSARPWKRLGDGNVQVYPLADPVSQERGRAILEFTRGAVDFFGRHYRADGDPGDVYIMQLPRYGDISSGNVSGISDESWHEFDETWISKYLLAHELVHTYTGRHIARSDPLWSLVVEGFPSYFHLPYLRKALGTDWYDKRLATVQDRYLRKRQTGRDRHGRTVPPEIPIDAITADEMNRYKDTFVLSDRVILFFDFLRRRMGEEDFLTLCRTLFTRPQLSAEVIFAEIAAHHPGQDEEITAWLSTTEFADWMKIRAVPPAGRD